MTRRDEHPLDDFVRRAGHVRDEDVARAWSGSETEQALLQAITTTPHELPADPTSKRTVGWWKKHRPSVQAHTREPRTEEVPQRHQRKGPRVARPVLAAIAVLLFAAGGLTFVLTPGGTQPAIAGWEPTPASVPADLRTDATTECAPPPDAAGAIEEQIRTFMNSDPQLAAIDVRGNAAVAVFADEGQYLICTLVEVDGNWTFPGSQHGTFDDTVAPGAGRAITADAQDQRVHGETSVTTLVGRVSQDVNHVIVDREDGMPIDATVRDGIFVAWWPSTHTFSSADAFNTDGELIGNDTDAPTMGFVNEF